MQRNMDELGRITIPANMRKQLEINVGDLINIDCDGNKVIITKPDAVDYKAIVEEAIKYIETSKDLEEDCFYKFKELEQVVELLDILNGKKD